MQRTDAMTFAESGAPPWWLRALLWGAPLGIVAAGWVDRGTDGAAGGAVAAAVVLLFATLPLEFSFAWYGGVRVVDGRLHVGRRSVPVHALDLSTMTFEVGPEIYSVFDRHRIMSNPIWLHDKLAVDGPSQRSSGARRGEQQPAGRAGGRAALNLRSARPARVSRSSRGPSRGMSRAQPASGLPVVPEPTPLHADEVVGAGGTDVRGYEHCTRQFGGQCHNGVVDRTADATGRCEPAYEGAALAVGRLQNRVKGLSSQVSTAITAAVTS
jgi:hypothetical protein